MRQEIDKMILKNGTEDARVTDSVGGIILRLNIPPVSLYTVHLSDLNSRGDAVRDSLGGEDLS